MGPRENGPHRARKRFGQHFLIDASAIETIIDLLDHPISGNDRTSLLEIGPGLGALTGPLVDRFNELTVVEIDRDLAERLRQRFGDQPNFQLIEQDALQLNLNQVSDRQVTIIGNLPYNISTPLLFHLFGQRQKIESMLFMLQKEVVQRMAADPGSKRYGRLSVMTQYYCEVEALLIIEPESFDPPPKVDSQMVRLRPKPAAKINQATEQRLATLVSAAFAQRRKTLRNTLSGHCTTEMIEAAGCDPKARAETLSLDQFIALANQSPD
ncbi:MAG: 16S rRNA (adenine(1518)-N(6)/adenine(1519)-N(6))-dimethyltransferase RsmA [Immundisolibacteraceae bacterium]|nr:16S rRNA (adenine(1518)-N(6)/adenine(1519)-N(6))-dimethyltransferase RsmA [Immundisolibacteraceae bacterium]